MAEERLEIGKEPSLQIGCSGSLKIKGWKESALLIKGGPYEFTEGEKKSSLQLAGDGLLLVPIRANLSIAEVAGDLAIRNVDGHVSISSVSGDLNLRTLAEVELGTIHGDLAVRNLNGPLSAEEILGDATFRHLEGLSIKQVYGDMAARNVSGSVQADSIAGDAGFGAITGDLSLGTVYGDLALRNMGGVCHVTQTLGDIRLRGGLTVGKHHLSASGKIVIRWPAEAPLTIEAQAPNFDVRLPLKDMVEQDGQLTGHIGDEGVVLILQAMGRIILKATDTFAEPWGDQPEEQIDMEFDFDLSGLGQHISTEINQRLDEWSARFENDLDADISADIERRVRKAATRAEKAAERAMRQAEKAAKKARWQAQRGGWSTPSAKPSPSAAKEKQATEEEQLKILRMVENGLITPDEATTLLEAIENG